MAKIHKKHTSSGFGMPSAHGSEWKGQDAAESKRRFDENFDSIDWSDDGGRKERETASSCDTPAG